MKNKFKNNQGVRYTKALFLETSYGNEESVLYTLKDEDNRGYPSLYKLYMEVGDPTEYKFATEYFDGLTHWLQICEAPWFKPLVERWRYELELKIKSESLANIREIASGAGKDNMQANRYLLEKKWDTAASEANSVGRPSKEEINRKARILANEKDIYEKDLERIKTEGTA